MDPLAWPARHQRGAQRNRWIFNDFYETGGRFAITEEEPEKRRGGPGRPPLLSARFSEFESVLDQNKSPFAVRPGSAAPRTPKGARSVTLSREDMTTVMRNLCTPLNVLFFAARARWERAEVRPSSALTTCNALLARPFRRGAPHDLTFYCAVTAERLAANRRDVQRAFAQCTECRTLRAHDTGCERDRADTSFRGRKHRPRQMVSGARA